MPGATAVAGLFAAATDATGFASPPVDAADAAGKWVGVCGELAGDPLAIPILIGLGVKELSMASGSIPRAKQVIRALKMPEARRLAAEALKMESAEAVRRFMQE